MASISPAISKRNLRRYAKPATDARGHVGTGGKWSGPLRLWWACECGRGSWRWVDRMGGGFLVGILLAAAVLFIVGHRANAGQMHASAEMNGSPEQIWPWLNEGDKLKQWVSWLVEVRGWESGLGVGAKRVWVM